MSLGIWYVSKYVIIPQPGDPVSRSFGLMRSLAQLGHHSVIISSDSMGKHSSSRAQRSYEIWRTDGVTICRARTLKYRASTSLRRIASWLDFERKMLFLPWRKLPKPDVIVVSSLSLLTILNGLRWRRQFGCQLIFEVRDIWPLSLLEYSKLSSRNPVVKALALIERIGYQRADAIIGTMPNLGAHVREVTGQDLATHCIPMGVDAEALKEPESLPEGFVDRYLTQGKFVVAYAGSIGIANAMDVFFECVESMREETEIHFVVLGDGEMRQGYIDRYGSLPNLTFAPRVPKAQVHDFLTRCDVLYLSVHKSKVWDYGLSLNKLIDYMLAAKPVVASYSGHPSMIDESGCGTFVPAADPIALRDELLRMSQLSSSEREEMGARGRQWLLANRRYEVLATEFLAALDVK